MKIVITKRASDYHACLGGDPEIWGCGKTPNEAIGDMFMSHTDLDVTKTFKIELEYK